MSSDYMVRKRERALFLGCRLKVVYFEVTFSKMIFMLTQYFRQNFSDEYHEQKSKTATSSKSPYSVEGGPTPAQLLRSNSIEEELLTTF